MDTGLKSRRAPFASNRGGPEELLQEISEYESSRIESYRVEGIKVITRLISRWII